MSVFDASSIIQAWDNYPITQFPSFWEWMEEQARYGEISIAKVALDEVSHMEPDCKSWLSNGGATIIVANNEIV